MVNSWQLALDLIPVEFLNTLYMVFVAAFFALLFGLPAGIALMLTDRGGLAERPFFYKALGFVVNVGRSIPFAILIVAIIPFTRWVVGTSIGTTASIVPLAIAAAPFIARLVESALKEVDRELMAAAEVMGSTRFDIVCKVLLPEALPALVNGVTLTLVTLVGYSAMVGLVGGGGLGKVAIQYGYQRFNGLLMLITVVVLVLLVETIQWIGNKIATLIYQRRGRRG